MHENPGLKPDRRLSPEELEIEKKLIEIEHKKGRFAELELPLENLKLELGLFQGRYHVRVGSLYVELDRLELQIDEYSARIRLIRQRRISASEMERILNDQFRDRRARIRSHEQETGDFSEEHETQESQTPLSDEEESELKGLYRRLARIYHPDLSDSEEERAEHQNIMTEINEAYAERDLDKLRAISRAAKGEQLRIDETIPEKLVRLIRESYELDRAIENLQKALEEFQKSPTFQLRERVEQGLAEGRDILGELEQEGRGKIQRKNRELQSLVEQYQELAAASQK